MALDIERLEWWISREHLKMKLKQSLEEIENEKLFCRDFKLKLSQDAQAEVTSNPIESDGTFSYEVKLKNQNNEQDNKTNHKD